MIASARFLLPSGAVSKGEKNLFLTLRVRDSSKVHNQTVRDAGLKVRILLPWQVLGAVGRAVRLSSCALWFYVCGIVG
jgi:hypothetical protein